jgi:hypothetical protein
MNVQQTNINDTLNFVNNTYDNLNYFDLYGNSIFIFIFITLLVFTVFSYFKMLQTKEEISNDWSNQRCKPQNMLFAGLISKPEGVSSLQYTRENFQYCVQNILTNITEYALEPFHYAIGSLTQVFASMVNSVQQSREVTSKLRSNIQVFAEDILGRILNVTIPIQKMFIAIKDIFSKIQGSMTASLYTMLGSYYALQSLMGAMLEMIIKMLVALVIIIVGLWTMPFTWPAAASMSAVFLSISVPLSIIIYFMTEVLHIKTSAIPKLRCFDEDTLIEMYDGKMKKIKNVIVGDKMKNGSHITSKIKVTSIDLNMYKLNNIVVSSSHLILYKNKWIRISEHPDAIKVKDYNKKYLYCLNTNNKIIELFGYVFSDWDEIVDDKLNILISKNDKIKNIDDIDKYLNNGFDKTTKLILKNKKSKCINEINIGDILENGSFVYGIVELSKDTYNILTNDGNLIINSVNVKDYNNIIDKFII